MSRFTHLQSIFLPMTL